LRLNFEAQVGRELRPIQISQIHKEKEMNFRRWITALAVLALFAGLASAQILSSTAGTGPFQCTASVAVPPVLRAEGLTEMVGDIVLTCTGGPTPVVSSTPISTANVTVSFQTNVTSRLLNYNSSTSPSAVTSPYTSEALLMIDEPGSGLQIGPWASAGPQNIGPGALQTLCTGPGGGGAASIMGAGAGGCPQYVVQVGTVGNQDYAMSSSPTSLTAPANVYAGIAVSNQVTFFGIPILPPTSASVSRVYRMTNIRINANALGASGFTGTFQVSASISISGSTSVPIYSPVQIAGFVQTGLTTKLQNTGNYGSLSVPNFNQCSTTNPVSNVGVLQYTENFGTAFKTRVAPLGLGTPASGGQATNSTGQNIPGAIYNSESGFIFPQLASYNTLPATAGLADYGTRLKAVFNNIPTGVRIFVSTTNVVNISGTTLASQLSPPPATSTTSFAQLVIGETAPEGSFVPASGYTTPSSSSVTQLNSYAELSVVGNSATAVWEVINTNPAANESFSFGVWTAYTANAAANTPPVGTATVNMSYAPTPDATSFTQAVGGAASSVLTIPRFADTSTAASLLSIIQCSTSLLFPFVTNQAGFDTGIAIMNTTSDPFGTKPQAGICTFWFYGQNAPPNYPTPIIPSGNNTASSTYAFLASTIAPNFQGYMISVCNFQLAHGYAFVSDIGAQKLAHGYLALILNNGTATRPPSSSNLQNGSATEQLEN
jgi:hypothetical protein